MVLVGAKTAARADHVSIHFGEFGNDGILHFIHRQQGRAPGGNLGHGFRSYQSVGAREDIQAQEQGRGREVDQGRLAAVEERTRDFFLEQFQFVDECGPGAFVGGLVFGAGHLVLVAQASGAQFGPGTVAGTEEGIGGQQRVRGDVVDEFGDDGGLEQIRLAVHPQHGHLFQRRHLSEPCRRVREVDIGDFVGGFEVFEGDDGPLYEGAELEADEFEFHGEGLPVWKGGEGRNGRMKSLRRQNSTCTDHGMAQHGRRRKEDLNLRRFPQIGTTP